MRTLKPASFNCDDSRYLKSPHRSTTGVEMHTSRKKHWNFQPSWKANWPPNWPPQAVVTCYVSLRDGQLEQLNFRAAGIFFRYQIPCVNFFQALARIFLRVNWRARIFLNWIFPSANFFFLYFARPPAPHKFSNGSSPSRILSSGYWVYDFTIWCLEQDVSLGRKA